MSARLAARTGRLSPICPRSAGCASPPTRPGLRYKKRADLMLAEVIDGTTVAGTFTRRCARRRRSTGAAGSSRPVRARAVICNAGNANAFTGRAGDTAAARTADGVAAALGVDAGRGLSGLHRGDRRDPPGGCPRRRPPGAGRIGLAPASGSAWQAAAEAIRTTDTFAKGAGRRDRRHRCRSRRHRQGQRHDRPRHGDDARVRVHRPRRRARPAPTVPVGLGRAPASTASPSTPTRRPATPCCSSPPAHPARRSTRPTGRRVAAFRDALDAVLLDLAHQIVRDGEGATKFVRCTVTGASRRRSGEGHRPVRSGTRRWSRPRWPPRTPTGAASSWRSARPASGRPRRTGHLDRRRAHRRARRRGSLLRRGPGHRAPARRRDRPARRRRHRRRRGHHLDL